MDSGNFVKVRLKNQSWTIVYISLIILNLIGIVKCNRPPRFLIDGQSEIVLRLKEGNETPIGTLIYKLRGTDPDGDVLEFGVKPQFGSNIIRIESISNTEANIFLNQELDRETRDEYALVLTLTDGNLGQGNYITQSLLLLVEDVNDNIPTFKPYQSSFTLREDAKPNTIVTLEATDADEGAYGQVIYYLQEPNENNEQKFTVSTVNGKGIVRLIGKLDYEHQSLHQLKVLAIDRAKQGRINTGTAAIIVKVEDVEDQPPEFIRMQPIARVAENSPIGTSVLQVSAVDGDRGINNPISYSLKLDDEDLFSIIETTGVVLTKKVLDREASITGAYILQITASEKGSKIQPLPTAVTEVTVMITDVNDEPPRFKSEKYFYEIPENAPINTPLTIINGIPEVYDHDQGNNGTFELYIDNFQDIFEITPSKVINEATFLIRVKNSTALDYEMIKSFNLSIVAKESVLMKPKYTEVQILVNIVDRNDNYPEFLKNVYEVWIPENCEIDLVVANVQAIDKDSGNFGTTGIMYTQLSGSIANLLNLNPNTGVITVKSSGGSNWDREQVSKHYLTVEARDSLGNGNRNSVQLIINIDDINDNAPIFSQIKYEARLLENEYNFEVPIKVDARDADLNGTKNSEIDYSLQGEFASYFTIESSSGYIRPKNALDFEEFKGPVTENIRNLDLIVRASDRGAPSLHSEVPLNVYLIDVNDFAPVFQYNFYNKSLPENVEGGTSIFQVNAQDLDGSIPNNQVVYRIQDGASDKFVIDPDSGILSIAKGAVLDPDLSQPRTTLYSLNILALDGATGEHQKKSNTTLTILILDVNNKPPVFVKPGIVNIVENSPVGTIVTRVNAVDMDESAKLRYKIDPLNCEILSERNVQVQNKDIDCATLFNIEEISGVLSVAKLIDREIIETINFGIIVEDFASDIGPQIDTAQVIVNVEDLNDNNPKFRKPFYKLAVTENSKNGILIGTVTADDADKNKTVVYSLEGRPDIVKLIYLDIHSGDLLVASKIDHEVYNWLNLSIKATDSGIPSRSTWVELFIQILDENDNNPFFLPDPRVLMIPEDTTIGQKVAVIEARDSDSGEFGKITYLLDRISSQGKFSLDPESGILSVAEELDREMKHHYLLVIEAWDNYQYGFNNGESRNAFKHINVTILDVNDNPPQLILPSSCVSITEFHEIGQAITTIRAKDADDPTTPNGQIVMSIASGDKLNLFALQQINEWSAEIRTTRTLQGRHGNFTLKLKAQDLGLPSHLVEKDLNICVADYNDHSPVFLSPPHNSTLKVPENATVGSALLQVVATDEDVGLNGIVRYKLKIDPAGHWKSFNLQPASGILELRLPLNRATQKIYDIRIEAYDLGVPTPLSSDLDLTVYVSNINDYLPQFMVDEVVVNFTENVVPGDEKFYLPKTVDRDELELDGPKIPICYFIVGGNENNIFAINTRKHFLTVNTMLDRETRDHYLILVKATEDCATHPKNESFFDSSDDTLLKVIINVNDANDNAPKFIHKVFTGGVSTATLFGTTFMTVKAIDPDFALNSLISYFLIGDVQMTLTEGLDNLQGPPFLVEQDTGGVQLNFDPQKGMKGYFDFMVLANDSGGLQDVARVFIYLLREDQRVRFILRQQPIELRNRIDNFREVLGNVTGAIVNIDEFRIHTHPDGTVDKTRTDLYLHLVNKIDHSILEVSEVLKLVDQNTERLDALFKDFNVLDTQPGETLSLTSMQKAGTTFWLTASLLLLILLLLLCFSLCINQRYTYQRKLKAAAATAYGTDTDHEDRGISGLSGRFPNTNKHSMEGSNPMWLKAYENEWYKNTDDLSQSSERDSLDENVLSEADNLSYHHEPNLIKVQNVYQTLPPILPPRKVVETTEL